MTTTYRVGISNPGVTMGWNEGGETTIAATDAESALRMAHEWANEGNYPGSCDVLLTAVNAADPSDRASETHHVA